MWYEDLINRIRGNKENTAGDVIQKVKENTPRWVKDGVKGYAAILKQYAQDKDREKLRKSEQDLKREMALQATGSLLDKYKAPTIVRDFFTNTIEEADKAARGADSFQQAFVNGAMSGVTATAKTVAQAAERGLLYIGKRVNDIVTPQTTRSPEPVRSEKIPMKGDKKPTWSSLPFRVHPVQDSSELLPFTTRKIGPYDTFAKKFDRR